MILRVAGLQTAHMGRLVEVAGEAAVIGFPSWQLGRIADVGSGRGFGVLGPGSVAGFARPAFPAARLLSFHEVVRIFAESIEDVFVAGLAGLRSGVTRRLSRGRDWDRDRVLCGAGKERSK